MSLTAADFIGEEKWLLQDRWNMQVVSTSDTLGGSLKASNNYLATQDFPLPNRFSIFCDLKHVNVTGIEFIQVHRRAGPVTAPAHSEFMPATSSLFTKAKQPLNTRRKSNSQGDFALCTTHVTLQLI